MKMLARMVVVGLGIAAVVGVTLVVLSDPEFGGPADGPRGGVPWLFGGSSGSSRSGAESAGSGRDPGDPPLPLFSAGYIDDSGYDFALDFTPPIADRSSLEEAAAAVKSRSAFGRARIEVALRQPPPPGVDPGEIARHRSRMVLTMGLLHMHDGSLEEAARWIGRARDEPNTTRDGRSNLTALLGVAALRRGELENCVACLGPASCIFPLANEAVHRFPDGSREAIGRFTEYLRERPEDLGVRWLLNVAHMTLGTYPDGVPPEYLIRLDRLAPAGEVSIGRFTNVAQEAGLGARGPNMLGGSIFDDFTGDGLPDIVVASADWDLPAALYVNRGDRTFDERTAGAGLDGQGGATNCVHADYDNDGDNDLLMVRGGWETPFRMSLLRNRGGGVFEDVTVPAGLDEPIASQSAAWGDFDGDGWLDLFVAGEYGGSNAHPWNHCRLYRNNGDGTFTNVAEQAGVLNKGWAKGVAAGDFDNDGDLDVYVSNMKGPNRLYRNEGGMVFRDVAEELGLTEPESSFSCWFWDYDNDGRLDLFVAGFRAWLEEIVADALGRPSSGERPRLYRNLGPGGFADVTAEAGLDRVWLPMGSNFGDVDNDGDLDLYLATGRPAYSNLVPNVLLINEGGRFVDATIPSGTGHLQKGHGTSFADYDGDGDLDLFLQAGGQTPGDRAHNVLFRNPGHGGHWLRVLLTGTTSNRSALGARVRADLIDPDGSSRTIHRVVGAGSSFGGNEFAVWLGLGSATSVERLTIAWPGGGEPQVLRDLPADRTLSVIQGRSDDD